MHMDLGSMPIEKSTSLMVRGMFRVNEGEPKPWESGLPDPDKTAVLSNTVARTWGSGRKILFVHGLEGRYSQFAPIIKALDLTEFEVTALDMPGHGLAREFQNNPLESSKAVINAVEEHGPFETIVAHSQGGISTLYALSQGVRVKRLVLVAPLNSVESRLRATCKLAKLPDHGVDLFLAKVAQTVGVPPSVFESSVLIQHHSAPTLVIHDTADFEVSFASSKSLSDANAHVTLIETNGLGHRRILNDDDVIRQAINFIVG